MGKSGISVDMDLTLGELASQANLDRANQLLTARVKDTTEKFVPMDHGDLRGNVEVGVDEFTYTEEYANRVYNMDDRTNWTTKGTSGHWIEPSKEANMADWEQFAADAILGAI